MKKKYMPYDKAQKFVSKQGFKFIWEYQQWLERPKSLPYNAASYYEDSGWCGWRKFLGHEFEPKYTSFEKAREYARKSHISSSTEWVKHHPRNMPKHPHSYYKDKGWNGWRDFLGTEHLKKDFLPFEEAREIARSLNLKSWTEWCKLQPKPANIPSAPNVYYRNAGWVDTFDWIGKQRNFKKKEFLSYEEAAKKVKPYNLKSIREWFVAHKFFKDIPFRPNIYYKDSGWVDWKTFLGY